MNIKITTFSLIVAATCGLAFNQSAKAEEEDVRTKPSMRFDFGANTYALDHVQSRHHYVTTTPATSVHSGAAPKSLLGLDPGFLAKPAPLPVAAPRIAQPTVSAKPIIANNSPFQALFGHPVQAPLTAPAAGALPFGKPAAPVAPLVAQAPRTTAVPHLAGKVLTHPRRYTPTGASATPSAPIATYGRNAAFIPGQVMPMSSGSGSTTTTDLNGVIIGRKHH